MSIDSYSFCPCGSGKKIKFCCCADLAAELSRIVRMFEGEQRLACLAEVDKLISTGKDRAAFLSIKSRLEIELEQYERARQTAELFAEKYPDNPLALCQISMLQAIGDENCNGVEPLQRALDICDGKVPSELLGAVEAVVDRLTLERKCIAARAHLMLLLAFAKDEDQPQVSSTLNDFLSAWQFPLFLRAPMPVPDRPDDAPWNEQVDEIMSRVPVGVWAQTAEQLERLTGQFSKEPWLWYQLANVRCWLGQDEAATEAFRRLATLKHVSLETAVEAEAIAQLLDASQIDEVDVMRVVYDVSDTDSLVELLLSDPHAVHLPIQPKQGATADEPPPKAVFDILDRPFVKSLQEVAVDNVAGRSGQLHVYGKQTDRNARVEWIFPVIREADYYTSHLRQILGDRLAQDPLSSEIQETMPIPAIERHAAPKFPTEGSVDKLEQFRQQYFNHNAIHEWLHLPMKVLDGHSPGEAAKIPGLRRALLATVLRLELSREAIARNIDINRLRVTLGLPRPDAIDPWKEDLESVPIWRLHRLDTVKLSDEQLGQALRRSILYNEIHALQVLGKEALARPSMSELFPEPFICALLARSTNSTRDALDYLLRAQEVSVANRESPAMFMIAELSYRLQRGEVDHFSRVVQEIQLRYLDQPGVAEKLYETLTALGIRPAPDSAVERESDLPVPETVPAETSSTGEIWTPESAKPSDEGNQSGIWLPEND